MAIIPGVFGLAVHATVAGLAELGVEIAAEAAQCPIAPHDPLKDAEGSGGLAVAHLDLRRRAGNHRERNFENSSRFSRLHSWRIPLRNSE